MRFAYYESLSSKERRIYRRSDTISEIELPRPELLHPVVRALATALGRGERKEVERLCQVLCTRITQALGVPGVSVRVLARRPRNNDGELHGLYTREEDGRSQIEVWMRTAAERRVVAFRTFLRTLLHEICHHLDFVHLLLGETYHTQGFFRRESSLVRQLTRDDAEPAIRAKTERPRASQSQAKRRKQQKRAPAQQLSLFR